jgi:hypothetical protein
MQRLAIEELQPRNTGLENALRDASAVYRQKILAHLLLAESRWATPIMGGKLPNLADADFLRARRQTHKPHLVKHPLAQSRHRRLLSLISGGTIPPPTQGYEHQTVALHSHQNFGEAVRPTGTRGRRERTDKRREERKGWEMIGKKLKKP